MSTPSKEELYAYFQQSMNYLNEEGEKFSKEYPFVASALNFSSRGTSDPDVQRLLESFAFLDARLQYNLNDKFSKISTMFLSALYPQFVNSIPSCVVMNMQIDEKMFKTLINQVVPKNTTFTRMYQQTKVTFSTIKNLHLSPLKIISTNYVRAEDTNLKDLIKFEWALALHVNQLKSLNKNTKTSIYIDANLNIAESLLKMILCYDVEKNTPIFLTDLSYNALFMHSVGEIEYNTLSDEESLLPDNGAADHYRLLMEYSIFPEKFLFFDLLFNNIFNQDEAILIIPLSKSAKPFNTPIAQDALKINCVPTINLFEKVSNPIYISNEQEKYLLTSDLNSENFAIYKICNMFSYDQKTGQEIEYYSYFEPKESDVDMFWYADYENEEVYVSLFKENFNFLQQNDEILYARTLSSNYRLCEEIAPYTEFEIGSIIGLNAINLQYPTKYISNNSKKQKHWQLISHMNLSHQNIVFHEKNIQILNDVTQLYNYSKHANYKNILHSLTYEKKITHFGKYEKWQGTCPKLSIKLTVKDTHTTFLLGYIWMNILSKCIDFYFVTEVTLYSMNSMHEPQKRVIDNEFFD